MKFRARAHLYRTPTREDGIDAATAAIIRLAVDGLIFTEMIDQKRIDPEHREKIKQRLLELVVESK